MPKFSLYFFDSEFLCKIDLAHNSNSVWKEIGHFMSNVIFITLFKHSMLYQYIFNL